MLRNINLSLVLAASTLERLISQVSNGDQAAHVAHVHSVGVAHFEEAFSQELRGTVRNLTIALHLTEAQTSVARSSLHRLPVEDLDGTAGTRVNLVVDHVLESLVVSGTKEDL